MPNDGSMYHGVEVYVLSPRNDFLVSLLTGNSQMFSTVEGQVNI
jgi:hypothetical protein